MKKILFAFGVNELEETIMQELNGYQSAGTVIYREAVATAIEERRPDIVILSDNLQGSIPIERILFDMKANYPDVRPIFITASRPAGDALLSNCAIYTIYDFIAEDVVTKDDILDLIKKPKTLADVRKYLPEVRGEITVLRETSEQVLTNGRQISASELSDIEQAQIEIAEGLTTKERQEIRSKVGATLYNKKIDARKVEVGKRLRPKKQSVAPVQAPQVKGKRNVIDIEQPAKKVIYSDDIKTTVYDTKTTTQPPVEVALPTTNIESVEIIKEATRKVKVSIEPDNFNEDEYVENENKSHSMINPVNTPSIASGLKEEPVMQLNNDSKEDISKQPRKAKPMNLKAMLGKPKAIDLSKTKIETPSSPKEDSLVTANVQDSEAEKTPIAKATVPEVDKKENFNDKPKAAIDNAKTKAINNDVKKGVDSAPLSMKPDNQLSPVADTPLMVKDKADVEYKKPNPYFKIPKDMHISHLTIYDKPVSLLFTKVTNDDYHEALNLAVYLAGNGRKVCLVDFNPISAVDSFMSFDADIGKWRNRKWLTPAFEEKLVVIKNNGTNLDKYLKDGYWVIGLSVLSDYTCELADMFDHHIVCLQQSFTLTAHAADILSGTRITLACIEGAEDGLVSDKKIKSTLLTQKSCKTAEGAPVAIRACNDKIPSILTPNGIEAYKQLIFYISNESGAMAQEVINE